MTPEQFWDGDADLVVAYRKAFEIKQREMNTQLWLQGAYIYEALCDVAPILQAFAKKGTKVRPYSKEPYVLSEKEQRERERQKEKEKMESLRSIFAAWATNINKKMKR